MQDNILLVEKKYLASVLEFIRKKINEIHDSINIEKTEAANMTEYIMNNKIDNIEIAFNQYEIKFADYKQEKHLDKIKKYMRVMAKPFFAKIELIEKVDTEEYYIGLMGIGDSLTNYVIDWRAPISSLYYYSDIGKTSYNSFEGDVKVKLTKKRQFIIESGTIKYYVDTDAALDNEILKMFLSKNTSEYMSNIVQTIQKEQNKIIREHPDKTVIINGVAGSGKTSIAIHRIAYLLYANKDKMKSENMINISPNKLFSAYISQLLPELGEENILTLTSIELFNQFNLLPGKHGSKAEMYEAVLNGDNDRLERIRAKMSYGYFIKLCNHLIQLNNYKLLVGLKINEIEINEDIAKKFFLTDKFAYDIYKSVERTVQKIAYHYFKRKSEKYIDKLTNKIVKSAVSKINPLAVFRDFLKCNGEPVYSGAIKYEDISSYAFINLFIRGVKKRNDILHLFIDEMQDYDASTFCIIKEIFPKSIFSIVGDFQQGLLYSELSSDEIRNFFPLSLEYELLTSYRSTIEIIQFANSVLGKGTIQNVIRNGKLPEVKRIINDTELCSNVYSILEQAKLNNYKVGILTKNITEANDIYKLFPDWDLLTNENELRGLSSRSLITTIYLSKGLEFDIVIIPKLDKSNFYGDIDRHYLYVAITRALHEVYGFFREDICEFIKPDYIED